MINRLLKYSVYILLIISLILLSYYIFVKIFFKNNDLETFQSFDMDKIKGWNKGCVGSIYVPFVKKCPKSLPYEWGPNNNMSHGICCNKYPIPEGPMFDKNLHDCVQGVLRSRCTGCKEDEYENGELPNDHTGICCSKTK